MTARLSAGRVRATYDFIRAQWHEYSIEAMCRVLEVAASGHYDSLKQPVCVTDIAYIRTWQGWLYLADAWRRFCRANHLEPSMSRKGIGDCGHSRLH